MNTRCSIYYEINVSQSLLTYKTYNTQHTTPTQQYPSVRKEKHIKITTTNYYTLKDPSSHPDASR